MEHFTSYDATVLAYRTDGSGRPVVCLPGGPGLTPDYLQDLGGLASSRQLVLAEMRGTGASAVPEDPATYRCDRLVGDVEALRAHLGLDRIDLIGHSAAANLAVLYAAAHPQRIERLALVTPDLRALGLEATDADREAAMERRSGEPWYQDAREAFAAANAGDESVGTMRRCLPFFYGRWDDAARAHAVMEFEQRVPEPAAGYYAAGAFDPAATRAVLRRLAAPVLSYAGDLDLDSPPEVAGRVAGLFPHAEMVVQPGAGHFPWVDDPAWFGAAMKSFLG